MLSEENANKSINTPVKKKKNYRRHLAHLFILPAALLYGVFQLYPLLTAVFNSFYSWNGFNRDTFIGFKNFIVLLTQEPYNSTFINAFKHNTTFFILKVFIDLLVAYLLALLIYSKLKGKEFFKVVFFIPKLLSVIVVGFLFSLILNPTSGALNTLLRTIGLDF